MIGRYVVYWTVVPRVLKLWACGRGLVDAGGDTAVRRHVLLGHILAGASCKRRERRTSDIGLESRPRMFPVILQNLISHY